MIINCPSCGYDWDYRGRLRTATCPSCSRKTKTNADAPLSGEPFKVGLLHALNGTMAWSEELLVNGALLAIDQVNKSRGVLGPQLEPILRDGGSNPKQFAEEATRLIKDDGVCALFGCWTSDCRKAVKSVVEEENKLLWYPVQYEGYEESTHVMYTGPTSNQQIIPAVDWCVRVQKMKRIFLVGSKYIFPFGANEIVRLMLDELDVECVGEMYVDLGETDFTEIMDHIYDPGCQPDLIFNTINGDSNVAFYRRLSDESRRRDVPLPRAMAVSIAENAVNKIGVDYMVGHYAIHSYFSSLENPANQVFQKAYRQKHGYWTLISDPIVTSYTQVLLFARALRDTGGDTDPASIRKAVAGLRVDSPAGPIKIDDLNNHCWRVPRIGQVKKTEWPTDGQRQAGVPAEQVAQDWRFEIVWDPGDMFPPDPFPRRLKKPTEYKQGCRRFQEYDRVVGLSKSHWYRD